MSYTGCWLCIAAELTIGQCWLGMRARNLWSNQPLAPREEDDGGVVACPVVQTYGSLALKDNSEVGEAVLDRCSIFCVCTSAFLLPAKEADPQLAKGPSGRGFGGFPYL